MKAWKKLAVAAAILAAVQFAAAAADEVKLVLGPYLQNVKPDEMTVMWETNAEAPSLVKFGETKSLGREAGDPAPVRIHEVVLKGLEQGKPYYYMISSGGKVLGKGAFHTTVAADKPFRLVVWGDNRTDFFTHERVARAMSKTHPDLAVNVGDVVTDGREYDQWKREYFLPIKWFAADTPSFIAVGNHEHNAHWYYDYVSQPGNEAWFSFDYGNTHFVIVDSNQEYTPGSPQYEWLVRDLSSETAQKATWLLLFKHHPEDSEGWDDSVYAGIPEMRQHLLPLYSKYGVDIVFSGHTHDYERGELDGVKHVISGGGGSALDTFKIDIPYLTVYHSRYQFCKLDIDGGRLELESVTPEGEVIDSFVLTK